MALSRSGALIAGVFSAVIASTALIGSAGAAPAYKSNVVVKVDGTGVRYITVHKGQKIWLAQGADNLNGIDVSVTPKGVLKPTKTDTTKLTDAQKKAIGFTTKTDPEGDVFTAAHKGTAKIKATTTRPTLGGIRTHWSKTVYVTVK